MKVYLGMARFGMRSALRRRPPGSVLGAGLCAAALSLGAPAWPAPPDPVRFGVAMELGEVDTAKKWLDEGLDPDFMGDRIGTGLMIAAWAGNIPLMELFFGRGAHIDKANAAGEQALMHAAWRGHLEAVKWLVARGARINRQGNQWSALHYAAFAGHADVARYLIEKGADINARSTNGSSPLMMAAHEGREQVARMLLEFGADTAIANDRGENALVWAMRYNNLTIAKMVATPEQFGLAARKPREAFGQAVRSVPVSARVEEIMRRIREAQAEDRPTEELRKEFWQAVAELEKELPPAAAVAGERPAALVIRAKKEPGGRVQESAEFVYERDRKAGSPSQPPRPPGKKSGSDPDD